jgi:hypothetical protein
VTANVAAIARNVQPMTRVKGFSVMEASEDVDSRRNLCLQEALSSA